MVSLRSVGLVGIGNVIPPIAAAASMPFIARAVGVDGRGDVAAATAPLLLASVIATLGLPDAITFLVASNGRVNLRKNLLRALGLTAAAGLVATGVAFGLRSQLSGGAQSLADLIALSALFTTPALLVNLGRGVAAGANQWRLVALEQGLSAILRFVAVMIFFFSDGLTLIVAVVIMSLAPVIGGVVYVPLMCASTSRSSKDATVRTRRRRHARPAGGRYFSDSAAADVAAANAAEQLSLTSYGVRIWAGSLSGVLLLRLDQLLILPLSDARQLGLYVVAVNVSEAVLVVNNAVRDVTFVSTAGSLDTKVLTRAARLTGTLSLLMALIVGLTVPLWLSALFGSDFQPAEGITLLMLVAVAVGSPGSIAGAGLSGAGRPGLRSWSLFAACIVNGVCIVVLVPLFGALGAAVATLIGNLIASNLNIVFAHRVLRTPWWSYYAIRSSDFRRHIRRPETTVEMS